MLTLYYWKGYLDYIYSALVFYNNPLCYIAFIPYKHTQNYCWNMKDSSKVIFIATLWLHIFLQRHCWHMTANEKRIYSFPALYSYLYIRRIRNIKEKNRGLSDMYIFRPFLFVTLVSRCSTVNILYWTWS